MLMEKTGEINSYGRWREELAEEVDSRIWSQIWWVAEAIRSKSSIHTIGESVQQLGLKQRSPLERYS